MGFIRQYLYNQWIVLYVSNKVVTYLTSGIVHHWVKGFDFHNKTMWTKCRIY